MEEKEEITNVWLKPLKKKQNMKTKLTFKTLIQENFLEIKKI